LLVWDPRVVPFGPVMRMVDPCRYDVQHRLRWLTRRKSPGKICRDPAVSATSGSPHAAALQK
jgi:hypothetical protein